MNTAIEHEDRQGGSTFSGQGFLFFREHPAYALQFPHEISLHHHEWHEFVVTRSFDPQVRHECAIDGISHTVGDWYLLSVPPLHLHRFTVRGLLTQYLIGVDPMELTQLFSHSPISQDLKNITACWQGLPACTNLAELPGFSGIKESIEQLFGRHPGNGTLGSLDSLLFLGEWNRILKLVFPDSSRFHPGAGSDRDLVLRAISFLEANYHRPVKVDDCADHLGISRSSLSHRFKQECGMSIPQWLGTIRIRHAKTLLQETDLDTVSIALECGFSDTSWFFRQFREAEGISPSRWRLMHKKQ